MQWAILAVSLVTFGWCVRKKSSEILQIRKANRRKAWERKQMVSRKPEVWAQILKI